MKLLIIEGINGAGKTTIYNTLIDRLSHKHSEAFLFLPQIWTQRMSEGFGKEERPLVTRRYLIETVEYLSSINKCFSNSPFRDYYKKEKIQFKCLLESFHLNNSIEMGLDFIFFDEVDSKVSELNAKLLVLVIDEDRIQHRAIESTKKNRSAGWTKYLEQLSRSNRHLIDIFKQRQKNLLKMSKKSKIKSKLYLNTTQEDWPRLCNEVEKFWLT